MLNSYFADTHGTFLVIIVASSNSLPLSRYNIHIVVSFPPPLPPPLSSPPLETTSLCPQLSVALTCCPVHTYLEVGSTRDIVVLLQTWYEWSPAFASAKHVDSSCVCIHVSMSTFMSSTHQSKWVSMYYVYIHTCYMQKCILRWVTCIYVFLDGCTYVRIFPLHYQTVRLSRYVDGYMYAISRCTHTNIYNIHTPMKCYLAWR